jgi:hypothetical protein
MSCFDVLYAILVFTFWVFEVDMFYFVLLEEGIILRSFSVVM